MTGQQVESLIPGEVLSITELIEMIRDTFDETVQTLVEQRDSRYENEIAPLAREQEALIRESASIAEAAANLKALLPARERVARRAADELLLSGQTEAAQSKLTEAEQAAQAPATMKSRRRELLARLEAIDSEKRSIAKNVFQQWYAECVTVHRAIEHAHFIVFLDGLKQAFFDFEQRTDAFAKTVGDPGLFTAGHLTGLTSDERSPEWSSASKWYGGRRR
jgi:DNA repair exonuclease SbcCD ATPase subunit